MIGLKKKNLEFQKEIMDKGALDLVGSDAIVFFVAEIDINLLNDLE